jgi:hypothetical protein
LTRNANFHRVGWNNGDSKPVFEAPRKNKNEQYAGNDTPDNFKRMIALDGTRTLRAISLSAVLRDEVNNRTDDKNKKEKTNI